MLICFYGTSQKHGPEAKRTVGCDEKSNSIANYYFRCI